MILVTFVNIEGQMEWPVSSSDQPFQSSQSLWSELITQKSVILSIFYQYFINIIYRKLMFIEDTKLKVALRTYQIPLDSTQVGEPLWLP